MSRGSRNSSRIRRTAMSLELGHLVAKIEVWDVLLREYVNIGFRFYEAQAARRCNYS